MRVLVKIAGKTGENIVLDGVNEILWRDGISRSIEIPLVSDPTMSYQCEVDPDSDTSYFEKLRMVALSDGFVDLSGFSFKIGSRRELAAGSYIETEEKDDNE